MIKILAYVPHLDNLNLETKEEKIVFFFGIIGTLLIWFVLDKIFNKKIKKDK